MVKEIEEFRYGGETIPVVTVIRAREAPAFFGVPRAELRGRLCELREQDNLVYDTKRLTVRVRVPDPTCKYGIRHVLRGQRRDFEKPRGRESSQLVSRLNHPNG